jgi:5-methylthioadenosine/S-adenosylhomocysteine deaminase
VSAGRTTLIEGGFVATMGAARAVHPRGYVLIRDGAIAAVGADSEVDAAAIGEVDERIDASGCIVVPGLINTHQHHWYNLFKGLGGGLYLEQWIQNLLVPAGQGLTVPDVEAAARLACLEMLGTGTTTCLNHMVTTTDQEWVEAALKPVVDSGMRQLFAKEIRPHGLDQQLALAEEVHDRWDGAADGRVRVGFTIESTAHWVALGTSSEELILRGHELATRLGVRITDHVAGGTMAIDHGYLRFVREHGRTDFEFLHGLGVLDEHWVLAHAINARDRDIELIAKGGASISHTPTSESARGGGIAPVRRFRDAGINVALGSDGPMVDTSVDMVEQMKATVLFQNQLRLDPSAITPEEALAMATIDAAAAIGLGDELGSLEAGKRGDVVVFDLDNPRCAPAHDPISALVLSARGADARHVLVEGRAVVRDGEFADFDREAVREVMAAARAAAEGVLGRVEVPAARTDIARGELTAIV